MYVLFENFNNLCSVYPNEITGQERQYLNQSDENNYFLFKVLDCNFSENKVKIAVFVQNNSHVITNIFS